MEDPAKSKGLRFVATCAAGLPALWLALFLLALPFPGGHPSLPSLVAMVPASLSLAGRVVWSLTGDLGTSSISLPVLVLATLVELAFVGAVAGVGVRRVLGSHFGQAPGVDFALLTESFASLNRMMFDRMVAALPDRPELLNPVFRIGFNNPKLGRALVDQLFELLQRPSIAKCVRLGMSFRNEWSDASHPKHRLYELANATCQDFTRADIEAWLSHDESPEEAGPSPLNATGLCQFVIDDRKGRPR